MLNISENSISKKMETESLSSFDLLDKKVKRRKPLGMLLILVLLLLSTLILPWTQNIQAKGYLTTLRPEQRPQNVPSVISGQLEQWFVKEGDFVKKGDTLAFVKEVKSEYFDPELIERTSEQIAAKDQSVNAYESKAASLRNQYLALVNARDLKLEQTKNKIAQTRIKIESDSIDLVAYQNDYDIAQKQLKRTGQLFDQGLKSLTDLEAKKVKVQKTKAKVNVQRNKIANGKNELQRLGIQLGSVQNEYADKLSKSESDRFTAVSGQMEAQANTSKLRNQLANYSIRQGFYYVTAPQSGYITKVLKKGVGEIIKEGAELLTIMPELYDLAVEIYVEPMDIPLLEIGNEVRLQFDGWPAVVFGGWPNASYGTFSGEVIAIDRYISENGKYRILVSPNDEEKPWPDLLRVGSGSRAFILLKEVNLWYEIWRQLNGFPPDFYKKEERQKENIKRKAPLKSVK